MTRGWDDGRGYHPVCAGRMRRAAAFVVCGGVGAVSVQGAGVYTAVCHGRGRGAGADAARAALAAKERAAAWARDRGGLRAFAARRVTGAAAV